MLFWPYVMIVSAMGVVVIAAVIAAHFSRPVMLSDSRNRCKRGHVVLRPSLLRLFVWCYTLLAGGRIAFMVGFVVSIMEGSRHGLLLWAYFCMAPELMWYRTSTVGVDTLSTNTIILLVSSAGWALLFTMLVAGFRSTLARMVRWHLRQL